MGATVWASDQRRPQVTNILDNVKETAMTRPIVVCACIAVGIVVVPALAVLIVLWLGVVDWVSE